MPEPQAVSVLLAPFGQLSGDGQLRESFSERRDRKGSDYPMWYLSPDLVKEFDLTKQDDFEAVVAEDPLVIAWLKLRFGGDRTEAELDTDRLREFANESPPSPKRRDIGLKRNSN